MEINSTSNLLQSLTLNVAQSTEKVTYTGLNNVLTAPNVFFDRRMDSFDKNTNDDVVTKEDALNDVWKSQHNSIDLSNPDTFSNFKLIATQEELDILLKSLQENGATTEMNSVDTTSLGSVNSFNLESRIDEFTAQYVATKNKIESNFTGDELIAEQEKLDQYFQDGYNAIVNEHSESLQANLSLSDEETQKIKDSFAHIIDEKIASYQESYDKVATTTEGEDEWLKSVDSYMTSAMHADNNSTVESTESTYSLNDLVTLSDVASYNIDAGTDEFNMALKLASIDMKLSSMSSNNEISEDMSNLLSEVTAQKKEELLNSATSNEFNKDVVNDIYNEIMDNYNSNGGNSTQAVKDSVDNIQTIISNHSGSYSDSNNRYDSLVIQAKCFFDEYARSDIDMAAAKYSGQEISSTTSKFNNFVDSYNNLFEFRY